MSDADPPPDDEVLAAELALGLADDDARAVAEGRLATEPAFAAAHARWIAYALCLSGVQAEPPGPHLWERIRARLPVENAVGEPRGHRRGWLAAAGIAAAFLLGLAAGRWWDRPPLVHGVPAAAPPVARPLVAVLTGADRDAIVAVSFAPGGDRLATVPKGVAPGDRTTELWVIPAGGTPHAIGLLPPDRPGWQPIAAPARPHLGPGATLAVSLEPAGGSPTGQPTGPVILTGVIAAPS